ncbi:MAG: NAD(P)-dependent oxidoreductase [Pseudomonadota bacterium]
MKILFSARDALWPEYKPALEAEFARLNLSVELTRDTSDPGSIDYIIYAPARDDDDLSVYKNVRLIQSLWAGPDKLLKNPTLTQPLARMVEPGMTQTMTEFVLGQVLYHHLHTQDFVTMPKDDWRWDWGPPLANTRTVGFLGAGALGTACAAVVHQVGFITIGWSRGPKPDAPMQVFHGAEGLKSVLEQSDILVLLLPNTTATENVLNAETLALAKPGVAIVNAGRGEAIDDAALLAALDSGQVRSATLDVFRQEPLPANDPYRSHPRVLVTPHVAAETQAATACVFAAENIARDARGETPLHLVDRSLNY